MRAPALAGLLMMVVADAFSTDPPGPPAPAAPASMRLRLSGDAIRDAVRATLAEQPSTPAADRGRVLSGNTYESFSRQVDEARVPSCWHPDGLKHQPAQIGPVALGGLLALPFLGAAILRGKCTP